ncbi:hypothetical protein JQC92_06270 [Shewanella sp. 202IG2-18]|uniref:hypothetical protein n=1 Tax=Parashewanella hymeniacidonis TaxID=2807618 RepID=UPI0019602698|nr:hypothetical protein [Parashewanella hymeniacidonis]MBM7071645.1 hypothetical protein [Parashewanella hymeniacidonis]
MTNVRAIIAPVVPGYFSGVSGEFRGGNELILTSTLRGVVSTKIYSVSKTESSVVVEKHIKFLGKTIGKFKISPRSVLFKNEAKKVYTAIAKNYLQTEFKHLGTDGIDGQNTARMCNIKRLMTKFHTQESVVALVADLSPVEGAKLLAWCANNSKELPEPLSTTVRQNPHKFVASCVECAIKQGYGSSYSPYNPETNSNASGKYSDLMTHITYHDDNLAIDVINSLEDKYKENPGMMRFVKALASSAFSEIGRTCKHRAGLTPCLSKLANINSKEVRDAIRETPNVFLTLLPELHENATNRNYYDGLTEKVKNSFGESLGQYSDALLEYNLKIDNHYLTSALSTNNHQFNCYNMFRLYELIPASDFVQKRNCHFALLNHSNIPSTLKYISEMDGRGCGFEAVTRQSELCRDFKVFVGANEGMGTFSVDRERLKAFINSPDISQDQKISCFKQLPLAVVSEIAKNTCRDYTEESVDLINEVVYLRYYNERTKNPNFKIPAVQLQLRNAPTTTTLPQQNAGNQQVFDKHVTFDARGKIGEAATGISQFFGNGFSPFNRRETVNHQHL